MDDRFSGKIILTPFPAMFMATLHVAWTVSVAYTAVGALFVRAVWGLETVVPHVAVLVLAASSRPSTRHDDVGVVHAAGTVGAAVALLVATSYRLIDSPYNQPVVLALWFWSAGSICAGYAVGYGTARIMLRGGRSDIASEASRPTRRTPWTDRASLIGWLGVAVFFVPVWQFGSRTHLESSRPLPSAFPQVDLRSAGRLGLDASTVWYSHGGNRRFMPQAERSVRVLGCGYYTAQYAKGPGYIHVYVHLWVFLFASFSLALVASAVRLAAYRRELRRHAGERCVHCNYLMAGCVSWVCPECGSDSWYRPHVPAEIRLGRAIRRSAVTIVLAAAVIGVIPVANCMLRRP